eukprot:4838102-Pyramimonas_sp.AAC.1
MSKTFLGNAPSQRRHVFWALAAALDDNQSPHVEAAVEGDDGPMKSPRRRFGPYDHEDDAPDSEVEEAVAMSAFS